ncbi:MAG TPA: ribonuclease T2 [Steroidobacteraceae bacterium]|jgi:ribonuclease T2
MFGSKCRWLAAALFIACLSASGGVSARHHAHATASAPGEFDYYLLSLSWSPAFCLSKPDSPECGGPRRYAFIVHGLWPQNERGWPEHCDVHVAVPDAVVDSIIDLMPARGLIYHEWSAHGTCSGLAPADFFALVRRAYSAVNIPGDFKDPDQPISQSPQAVVTAFAHANPQFPKDAVVASCSGQSTPRLREVHVCFDKELKARACSVDALKEACKAGTLIIPPVR